MTVLMKFRPGLQGLTQVTNVATIVGSEPFDACVQDLDPETGECSDATTAEPTGAGALRGQRDVRAADPQWGVHNHGGDDAACIPDAANFYRGNCVPVTEPGGEAIWRLRFGNTGNLPLDRIYTIDRLPIPGDTGAIIPTARGSQFRPLLTDVRLIGVTGGEASRFEVFYTSSQDL